MSLTFCLFYVREATVGCVAADCNPAHQKHRWFDSNRVHQFMLMHSRYGASATLPVKQIIFAKNS